MGTTALAGRRFAASCQASDDCNDTAAAVYRLVSSRADQDNDTYCAGFATNDCVGAGPLPGRRFTAACVAWMSQQDDCDDTNPNLEHYDSHRVDMDGDQYCVGPAMQLCVGATTPVGLRRTIQCNPSDDCNDANTAAHATCLFPGMYQTQYHQQTCPGPGTFTNYSVTVAQACPAGFSPSGPSAQRSPTSDTAQCNAVNLTTIAQRCEFLAGSTCRVIADCVAN